MKELRLLFVTLLLVGISRVVTPVEIVYQGEEYYLPPEADAAANYIPLPDQDLRFTLIDQTTGVFRTDLDQTIYIQSGPNQ